MKCWKCNKPLENIPEKVPFRASCDHCGSWLHACINCKFHHPGMANDCAIPDTEHVADNEMCNFCEEYEYTKHSQSTSATTSEAAKILFGDENETNMSFSSPRFNDLFKD